MVGVTVPITRQVGTVKGTEAMRFIEMTGKVLADIVQDDEIHAPSLPEVGIGDETVVRVNEQGDIEIRLADRWDVIGGLLGNYEARIKRRTGLDWVHPCN